MEWCNHQVLVLYAYTWLKPTVPHEARTRSASLLFRSDMHETECGADHTQLQEQKTNLRFALSPSVFMVLPGSSTPIRTMNMQYILPRWSFPVLSNTPVVHFPTDIERGICVCSAPKKCGVLILHKYRIYDRSLS